MKNITMATKLTAKTAFICFTLTCFADKSKLANYKYNIYSQYGEDGIIEKIFEIIKPTSKFCVEFGAADGFFFSNTANLWANKGWKAILIEPDPKGYEQLKINTAGYNCVILNEFVDIGEHSLDKILSRLNLNENIDLLSIDIDGNDYYILESIKTIKPSVIICEYNPTISAELDVHQAYEFQNFGSSVGALNRIATTKGYFLAAITDTNCIFIDEKYREIFSDFELDLSEIRFDKYVKHIAFDMVGRAIIFGNTNSYTYAINSVGSTANIFNNEKLNFAKVKINNWQLAY